MSLPCLNKVILSYPILPAISCKGKYPGRRGVLPEKLGGDVQPASQNPYPIYD